MTLSPEFDPYIDWETSQFEARVDARGPQGVTEQQAPSARGIETIDAGLPVAQLRDEVVKPGTIYYSLDHYRLVYKDSDGNIHALTGNRPVNPNVKEDPFGPQFNEEV